MGSVTYKAVGGRYEGNGLNSQVRWFPAQGIAKSVAPEGTSTTPLNETHPKIEILDIAETPHRSPIVTQTEPPSEDEASASYEVSKRRLSSSGSDDGETSYGDDDVRGAYEVSSPYLKKMRFIDEQYGIRRDSKSLMIGNSAVIADEKYDITIGGTRFRGKRGLWEHFTRKNVNRDVITNSDQKLYKRILELTNAHFAGYEPGSEIQISRGAKYAKVISKLFPHNSRRAALRQHWTPRRRWSPFHDGRS